MTNTSPGPRTRPRRAEVRDQVLRAAAEALVQNSYADVSVADIARAAGFTKGAVYSNFGGKPELFAAVLAEQFSELIGGVLTTAMAAVETQTPPEVPHLVAASLTRGLVRDQRLPLLLAELRALARRDPQLATVYAELRLRQRAELEQLLAGVSDRLPLAPGVDLPVAAALLLTCVNNLSLEYAAAPASTPEPLIEAVLTHVLAGLLA
jgi:AcrR family transcriptional regulator